MFARNQFAIIRVKLYTESVFTNSCPKKYDTYAVQCTEYIVCTVYFDTLIHYSIDSNRVVLIQYV